MSDLRKAAQVALDTMDFMLRCGEWYCAQERADALRAALAQPEQLVVGGDDLPTLTKWTPRSEALKQAGYTRRPRQLPKEDEQEPVLYKWAALFEDPNNDWQAGYESARRWVLEVGLQSIATPPQRKPLTKEEIYEVLGYGARAQYSSLPQYAIECVRAIEKAHGIGGEE
jgi:hypothetical protein